MRVSPIGLPWRLRLGEEGAGEPVSGGEARPAGEDGPVEDGADLRSLEVTGVGGMYGGGLSALLGSVSIGSICGTSMKTERWDIRWFLVNYI